MQMQAVSKLTSQPQNPISLRLSPGHRVNTHACSHLQGAQQRPCRVKPQTSVSQVHVGASATQPTSPAPVSPVQQASTQHKWKWGKHTINYVVRVLMRIYRILHWPCSSCLCNTHWCCLEIYMQTAGCGAPVILVHGFGLSSGHYRKNIVELAKTNKVYAIDLLGFGVSYEGGTEALVTD